MRFLVEEEWEKRGEKDSFRNRKTRDFEKVRKEVGGSYIKSLEMVEPRTTVACMIVLSVNAKGTC